MSNYRYWQGGNITSMTGNNVFVFGSNPEGRHGAGAAKAAMQFGAKYGVGRGHRGNTYALPTKNLKRNYFEVDTGIVYGKTGEKSISREQIIANIADMYVFARDNTHLTFFVSYMRVANLLNGYSSLEMIEMFTQGHNVPDNIRFHNSFREVLEN